MGLALGNWNVSKISIRSGVIGETLRPPLSITVPGSVFRNRKRKSETRRRGAQQNNAMAKWRKKSACENFHDHATFCALRAERSEGGSAGKSRPTFFALERT